MSVLEHRKNSPWVMMEKFQTNKKLRSYIMYNNIKDLKLMPKGYPTMIYSTYFFSWAFLLWYILYMNNELCSHQTKDFNLCLSMLTRVFEHQPNPIALMQ